MIQLHNVPRLLLAVVIIALIGVGLYGSSVSAQSAAEGLQISPALIELSTSKGGTYTISVKVTNVTTSDLRYTPSVNDFAAKDETGAPNVLLESNLGANASIRSWLSTVPSFDLASRQSKTITAQVTIPLNAEPGGHYGVLRFSGSAPEISGTGVGLAASAGVLLLIRVDGAISEKASLASFFASSPQSDKQSSFFETGPIKFQTRVKNEGNIHVKPVGEVQIHDSFGGLVGTLPINDQKANLLPDSVRRFDSTLNSSWMFGRYTADLTLGYGSTGQALTNTITFWVIPYKLILTILIGAITLIFIFTRLIKVYNRHIIEKSNNGQKTKNKKTTSRNKKA